MISSLLILVSAQASLLHIPGQTQDFQGAIKLLTRAKGACDKPDPVSEDPFECRVHAVNYLDALMLWKREYYYAEPYFDLADDKNPPTLHEEFGRVIYPKLTPRVQKELQVLEDERQRAIKGLEKAQCSVDFDLPPNAQGMISFMEWHFGGLLHDVSDQCFEGAPCSLTLQPNVRGYPNQVDYMLLSHAVYLNRHRFQELGGELGFLDYIERTVDADGVPIKEVVHYVKNWKDRTDLSKVPGKKAKGISGRELYVLTTGEKE